MNVYKQNIATFEKYFSEDKFFSMRVTLNFSDEDRCNRYREKDTLLVQRITNKNIYSQSLCTTSSMNMKSHYSLISDGRLDRRKM